MIHGIDTSFLVTAEVSAHPRHAEARRLLDRVLQRGDGFAMAPQVLVEFIHVVTDNRRFEAPLSLPQARDRAERWWTAEEVRACSANEESAALFLAWHREHDLGRKRLLDTLLAATYVANEIRSIVTANPRDFEVFGHFELLTP